MDSTAIIVCFFELLCSLMFIFAFPVSRPEDGGSTRVSCFSCPIKCVCSFPRLHHHKWIVNCSSTNLTTIPTDISPAVEYLDLSNNQFYSDAKFSILKHFSRLKWLNLNNCGIVNVTVDAICMILYPTTVLMQGNKHLTSTNRSEFCLTSQLRNLTIDAETLLNAENIPDSVKSLSIHAGDQFEKWETVWSKIIQKKSISTLRIQGKSLGIIPTNVINKMNNLKRLELISCQIKNLDVLINAEAVVRSNFHLSLSRNHINVIPANAFRIFKNTKTVPLDLSHNNITRFDKEAFCGISKIGGLILDNNDLGQINFENILEGLRNKTILELSVSKCKIDHKQMTRETLAPLRYSQIQKMNFGENRYIDMQADNLYYTPKLREIIFNTFVYAQTDSEDILGDMRYVHVSNMAGDTGWALLSSPATRNLEKITISNWNIDLRPQEILQWRVGAKLKEIEILDTKCGYGFNFEQLQQLEKLYFYRTDCTGVHIQVSDNNMLKEFSLKRNLNDIKLQEMHTIFRKMRLLEVLDLGGSNIIYHGEEKANTFNLIRYNLKELYLPRTNLKSLQYIFVDVMFNLELLDLSHNKLDVLDHDIFKYTPNLKVIYLQGNVLQYFDPVIIEPLQTLNYIDISDNKFRCGCELRPLAVLLRTTKMVATETPTCDQRSLLNIVGMDAMCINNPNSTTYTLVNYKIFWMNCDNNMLRFFATLSAVLLIFIAIIASIIYRNRLSILIMWNRLSLSIFKPRIRDYSYDCYVSYSDGDSELVQNMHHEIEEKYSKNKYISPKSSNILKSLEFHFCFRDKDFIPGKAIIDNITSFMDVSKTILFIISPFSVDDVWCQFEAEYGFWSFVLNNKKELIVLFTEDVDSEKMCLSLRNILKHSKIVRTSNGCIGGDDIYTKLRAILSSEPGCLCQGCL